MKIFVCPPHDRSRDVMANIVRIVSNSLVDLGHIVSTEDAFYEECELTICVRTPFNPVSRRKIPHILYQVELYQPNRAEVEMWYQFGWDEIWDCNEVRNTGKYVPIGYHPCLKFTERLDEQSRDVGFLGNLNARRWNFLHKAAHKYEQIRTYNSRLRGLEVSKTKINLNIHAYENFDYVEWDRVGHFLANDCFFISERWPCDLPVPVFSTVSEYDKLVEKYLHDKALRDEVSTQAGLAFQEQYDMRNILRGALWATS